MANARNGRKRPRSVGGRSSSPSRWIMQRRREVYARKARKDGYPSRATYKLQHIQQKTNILAPGQIVVDLGAAPGGWSCYALEVVRPHQGKVIAIDLLEMPALGGKADTIIGDITDRDVLNQARGLIDSMAKDGGNAKDGADVVLCDACVTIRGIASVDSLAQGVLTEQVLSLAAILLRPGGNLVIKMFHGGEQDTVAAAKSCFARVTHVKPPASRSESREIYLVGHQWQGERLPALNTNS